MGFMLIAVLLGSEGWMCVLCLRGVGECKFHSQSVRQSIHTQFHFMTYAWVFNIANFRFKYRVRFILYFAVIQKYIWWYIKLLQAVAFQPWSMLSRACHMILIHFPPILWGDFTFTVSSYRDSLVAICRGQVGILPEFFPPGFLILFLPTSWLMKNAISV